MKYTTGSLIWVAVLALILVSLPLNVMAQTQKMKYKDYLAELERWRAREQVARAAIAEEDALQADLRDQIQQVDAETESVWDEIFALLGVTRQDYEQFQGELADLESQVRGLQALSPEQLYQRRDEVDAAEEKFGDLRGNPCALIPRDERRLNALARDIEALKARIPGPRSEQYSVVSGDCLWRIAGKSRFYSDPYKWLRIWSANLDKINDPDLIFPQQIFYHPL